MYTVLPIVVVWLPLGAPLNVTVPIPVGVMVMAVPPTETEAAVVAVVIIPANVPMTLAPVAFVVIVKVFVDPFAIVIDPGPDADVEVGRAENDPVWVSPAGALAVKVWPSMAILDVPPVIFDEVGAAT